MPKNESKSSNDNTVFIAKVVQWPWPVVTMKRKEYDLTEPKFLSLNRIKILWIWLKFISYFILPTMMSWDVIKESGIYWNFKSEVLQKHTFKKIRILPNLFSRRMSGWWMLKKKSLYQHYELCIWNKAQKQCLCARFGYNIDLLSNIRKNKNTIIMLNRTGMVLNIHWLFTKGQPEKIICCGLKIPRFSTALRVVLIGLPDLGRKEKIPCSCRDCTVFSEIPRF
jgi:hypothetical protein